MTATELIAQLATALFAGGGAWLAVREIAKQIGETRRERIRQQGETERLTIARAMPLPAADSAPAQKAESAPAQKAESAPAQKAESALAQKKARKRPARGAA
ncbi:hypothetical protein [Paractinoplanes deccanensis]|uniref:hypothetical protein n=2 Tax=Paractinoplanes deccanensis TaxID=113561 RepID=UPI0031D04264